MTPRRAHSEARLACYGAAPWKGANALVAGVYTAQASVTVQAVTRALSIARIQRHVGKTGSTVGLKGCFSYR